MVRIREATGGDWPSLYPIFAAITEAGRTYAYPQHATSEQARAIWMDQGRVVIAEGENGALGTAAMGANRAGRGSPHRHRQLHGRPRTPRDVGSGGALGEHVIDWARSTGFRGIQFNAVVQTNHAAIHLWRSLGFTIIGTVPGAFHHPEHGYVGLHVMYRPLP